MPRTKGFCQFSRTPLLYRKRPVTRRIVWEDVTLIQQTLVRSYIRSLYRIATQYRLTCLWRLLLACIGAVLAQTALADAQQPSPPPGDAALYEAAKKEGRLVWYVGGPLD